MKCRVSSIALALYLIALACDADGLWRRLCLCARGCPDLPYGSNFVQHPWSDRGGWRWQLLDIQTNVLFDAAVGSNSGDIWTTSKFTRVYSTTGRASPRTNALCRLCGEITGQTNLIVCSPHKGFTLTVTGTCSESPTNGTAFSVGSVIGDVDFCDVEFGDGVTEWVIYLTQLREPLQWDMIGENANTAHRFANGSIGSGEVYYCEFFDQWYGRLSFTGSGFGAGCSYVIDFGS